MLLEKIKKHFGCVLEGLTSLEIGCGRAVMSDYLYNVLFDTHCVDKYYIPPKNGRKHKFWQADAFKLPFEKKMFDLVISYGLLEHYELERQILLLHQAREVLKPTGLSMHYVVPKKHVNMFEDRNVYRDPCYFLRDSDIIWVYPVIRGLNWKTNQWLGKGFWYEDTSCSDSEVYE